MKAMILVIDDEKNRSFIIKEYLEELENREVELIDDIDEAYKFIKNPVNNIEAIILDIMMPPGKLLKEKKTQGGILTGFKFYKKIKQELGAALPPVIIYSAINKDDILNTLKNKPNNCIVIRKPDSVEVIANALNELIKKS